MILDVPGAGAVQVQNGGIQGDCLVCGSHGHPVHAVCDECGADSNVLNSLIAEQDDDVLFVGGAGYGVGGAYSDTFHALKDGLQESVCGRLKTSGTGTAASNIQWREAVFSMTATEPWQSGPCGHCKRMGAFEAYQVKPEEVVQRVD